MNSEFFEKDIPTKPGITFYAKFTRPTPRGRYFCQIMKRDPTYGPNYESYIHGFYSDTLFFGKMKGKRKLKEFRELESYGEQTWIIE